MIRHLFSYATMAIGTPGSLYWQASESAMGVPAVSCQAGMACGNLLKRKIAAFSTAC